MEDAKDTWKAIGRTIKMGWTPPGKTQKEEERDQRRLVHKAEAKAEAHRLQVEQEGVDTVAKPELQPHKLQRNSNAPGSRETSPRKRTEGSTNSNELLERYIVTNKVAPTPSHGAGSIKGGKADKASKKRNEKDSASTKPPRSSFFSRGKSKTEKEATERPTDNELEPKVGPAGPDMNKRLPELKVTDLGVEDAASLRALFSNQSQAAASAATVEHGEEQHEVAPVLRASTEPGAGRVPDSTSPQREAYNSLSFPARDPDHALIRKPVRDSFLLSRTQSIIPTVEAGTSDGRQTQNGISDDPSSAQDFHSTVTSRSQGDETGSSKGMERELTEGLEKASRYYHRLKKEHTSAQFQYKFPTPLSVTQIEPALQALIDAYVAAVLESSHLKDIIETQAAEITSLKNICDDIDRVMSDSIAKAKTLENENTRKLSKLEGAIETYEKREEKVEERMQKLRQEHNKKEEALTKDHQRQSQVWDAAVFKLKDEYAKSMKQLKLDHQNEMTASTSTAKELLSKTRQKLEDDLFQEEESHSLTKRKYGEKFETLKKEYERQLSEISAKHEAENRKIRQDLLDKKKEMEIALSRKRIEHDTSLEIAAEGYRASLAATQAHHDSIIKEMNREISDIKSIHAGKIHSTTEDFKNQVAVLRAKLDHAMNEKAHEIRSIKDAHKKTLKEANDRAQEQLEDLNFQLEQTKDKKAEEIRAIRNLHASQTHIAEQKHQREIANLTAQVNKLTLEKGAESDALRGMYEDVIVKLKESHKKDKAIHLQAVQLTNEALKIALVTRDHFIVMSDNEVSRRYHDINIEVDELARIPWDKSREKSWPFLPSSFRTSENERRAKKDLIGNTLWVVLYQMIFCTPFRMLGKEGKSLEQQWVKKYSQNSTYAEILYPRPTKDSEAWRYETMMKCVEATRQPLTQSDYSIKRGYEATLEECTNQLVHEIEAVASVNSSDKERMRELVKTVAELWLEVGQLRCRIFASMSESDKLPVRSRQAALGRDGILNLVVMPELRRSGNDKGDRLEMEEIVMDCRGKFSTFRAG